MIYQSSQLHVSIGNYLYTNSRGVFSSFRQALLWSDTVESGRHEKHLTWNPETIPSILTRVRRNTKRVKVSKKTERATHDTSHLIHNSGSRNATITGVKTGMSESKQNTTILRESSVQTE